MSRLLVVIYEILMRNILPDNSDLFQLVCPDKKNSVSGWLPQFLFGRAPPHGGSGFPFQVLATRTSWLRAFHCNPSRIRLIIS